MGAGKTTAGKKLATIMSYNFLDLDHFIETENNLTIADLFEQGAQHFRTAEATALRKTKSLTNTVVSVGGGAPCFHSNMDWMNQHGITVYIRLTVGSLFHRLAASKQKRPLIAKKTDVELMEFILTTLKDRLVFYNQSKYVIKGESLDVKELFELLKKGEPQLR